MTAFEPVRALVRGLDVLRVVSENSRLTASEISKRLNIPQPTIVRILETLIAVGYVYRDLDAATFGVTAKTKSLSSGYDMSSRVAQLAQPTIEALRQEIGWPSNLSVPVGRSMVIAYTNRAAHGLSMPGRLGAQLPMLATATGIVYLANLDDAAQKELLSDIKSSSDPWDSLPALWKGLKNKLERVKAQGYGLAEEQYLDAIYQSRLWAVAVPIHSNLGVEAAISSLVLRDAGDQEEQIERILPNLRQAAHEIGREIDLDRGIGEIE